MRSLAYTEMEWVSISQAEASDVINDEAKHHRILTTQPDLRSDAGISLLARRTTAAQNQLHQFRNFLSQPMTQSSVVGASCATTTSVHATSAPMSTTYYSSMNHSSHVEVEHLKDSDVNHQLSNASLRGTAALVNPQMAVPTQPSISKEPKGCKFSESKYQGNPTVVDVKQTEAQEYAEDVANAQSQVTLPPNLCSDTKSEPLKSEKQEKAVSGKAVPARKKNKDSDLFIKVNGKLYQRLGKIGCGGSSEVHKVISSDCTISLKKIKLKGRDYATAFGFCQEIEYLNKLKGKSHIIHLIDYDVGTCLRRHSCARRLIQRETLSSVIAHQTFADYKTCWAKFKVITDPNHQIVYEPVPNPWLLDLMKKCLACSPGSNPAIFS